MEGTQAMCGALREEAAAARRCAVCRVSFIDAGGVAGIDRRMVRGSDVGQVPTLGLKPLIILDAWPRDNRAFYETVPFLKLAINLINSDEI
jgi:hypothetical protein